MRQALPNINQKERNELMNGHGKAETLAFGLLEVARRLSGEVGDSEDAPIFVFAADGHSGDLELCRRLAHSFTIAREPAVEASIIDGFARQLIRLGMSETAGPHPVESHVVDEPRNCLSVRACIDAQVEFLRALAPRNRDGARRWGLAVIGLTGDYALHLKLLFPRAKFVFLHRDPLESFRQSIRWAKANEGTPRRDPRRAASFAEHWCKLVASFELWHTQVGALVIGNVAGAIAELEQYVGERLAPPSIVPLEQGRQLHADDVKLLAERTGEIAARCGYGLVSIRATEPAAQPLPAPTTTPVAKQAARPVNCAVLVPAMSYIEPRCEDALRRLERRGYAVSRMRGCSSIDQARNMLATAALDQGFAETLWVDADTEFDPDVVERIRFHGAPIVAGICARRRAGGGLAVAPLPGTRELVMGEGGGLVEVLYAGTGFLLVRRDVYIAIQRRFGLPLCNAETPRRSIPYFMPMLEDWGGRLSYLGEDYAFSRRARLCGYKILADTTIRLWHIGHRRYGIGDDGNELARQATYTHVFKAEG